MTSGAPLPPRHPASAAVPRRIHGPALVIDGCDAARVDAQLREALRHGWLARGLLPPRALVEFADEIATLARQFRASAQASAPGETGSPRCTPDLSLSDLPERLSATQAAQVIGVTPQYARRLAAKGALTGVRDRGQAAWVIDTASALAWAADRRENQRSRNEAA